MKTDRELLELAAKAAGLCISIRLSNDGLMVCSAVRKSPHKWNPMTDDGDALRLAVKLNLSIDTNWYNSDACWLTDKSIVSSFDSVEEEPHNDDPYAATRRAIVRAAASIGETL